MLRLNADGTYMSEDQMVADLQQYTYPDGFAELVRDPTRTTVGALLFETVRKFIIEGGILYYGLNNADNPHARQTMDEHPLRPDHVIGRVINRFFDTMTRKSGTLVI